ncbi:MAG TPA: hypothetical protein VIS48_00370 [Candidatus Kryptonia bacterium]
MNKLRFLLCSLLFVACNTTGPSSSLSIQVGTYEGTFSITNFVGTDSASTQQSQATFTFSDTGWYTCRGGLFLPGAGEYKILGDSLYLTDMLARVAIFDLTQVLDGSFHVTMDGDSLVLAQNDERLDRYRTIKLKLQ